MCLPHNNAIRPIINNNNSIIIVPFGSNAPQRGLSQVAYRPLIYNIFQSTIQTTQLYRVSTYLLFFAL